MKYKNVYFFNGTAYAGKSTMAKLLAEKYNGILCEENFTDRLIFELDENEFPCLTYTRNLKDWALFIRRTPDEYEKWYDGCVKECDILEQQILDELVKENRPIFVDTNMSLETLKDISDKDHVLIMLTDPNISVARFFEREDKEKHFLYKLLLKENNPDFAIENFRNCLKRVNSKERYDEFLNSGFNVLLKDDKRTKEETLELVEKFFMLK